LHWIRAFNQSYKQTQRIPVHRPSGGECHGHQEKGRPTARDDYVEMSGTSMATPHVSGLLAAFLSVRKEFIG